MIQDNLHISGSLTASVKSLLPHKVTFTGIRNLDLDIFRGDYSAYHKSYMKNSETASLM